MSMSMSIMSIDVDSIMQADAAVVGCSVGHPLHGVVAACTLVCGGWEKYSSRTLRADHSFCGGAWQTPLYILCLIVEPCIHHVWIWHYLVTSERYK
jgi:hypothetical protein